MPFFKVFLCLLALLFLPGCDTSRTVEGYITAYHTDEQDKLTGLSVQLLDGETMTFVPAKDEEYRIVSWLGADTLTEIQEKFPGDLLVSAKYGGKTTTLIQPDGTQLPAYVADWVMDIAHLKTPGAYTLPDGVTADLWEEWSQHNYCLPDRTELLRVDGHGPENVYGGSSMFAFEDLSPAVQERILAFYEAQGLLYDEFAELERAYRFYLTDPDNFQSLWVGQEISPYYANENIISFLTTVTLPLSPGRIDEFQLCHTFDRNTGEQISNYDLFTAPPEEVVRTLLELGNYQYWDTPPVVEEIVMVLKPEYIHLSDDYLSIDFPSGTFDERRYGFGFNHTPETWKLIQPWARPEQLTS